MKREIESPPGAESLVSKEAADWLGIPEDTFLDLVRLGLIPEGAFISHKTRRWPWEEVAGVKLLLRHLLARRKELREESRKTRVKPEKVGKIND